MTDLFRPTIWLVWARSLCYYPCHLRADSRIRIASSPTFLTLCSKQQDLLAHHHRGSAMLLMLVSALQEPSGDQAHVARCT